MLAKPRNRLNTKSYVTTYALKKTVKYKKCSVTAVACYIHLTFQLHYCKLNQPSNNYNKVELVMVCIPFFRLLS